MSGGNINSLLDLWTSAVLKHQDDAPFSSHGDLYNTIDDTTLGDVNWQCFALSYSDSEDVDTDERHHPWKTARYAVYYRDPLAVVHNMLANPDFKDRIDYAPFREMSPRPGGASETLGSSQRRLENFMGGEWAWRQAVCFPFSHQCRICLTASMLIDRTPSQRIVPHRTPPSFPLSLEATKLLSPSPRVRTNITRYIVPSGTCTTAFVGLIRTPFLFLVF